MKSESSQQVVSGSVKSDWRPLVDSAGTAINSNATADGVPTTLNATTVGRLNVPPGATRVLLRQTVDATGVTVSATVAQVAVIGLDGDGRATRLDQADFNSTSYLSLPLNTTLTNNPVGITMEGSSTTTTGIRFGSPVSLTGLDLLGAKEIRVPRAVASAHTGGTRSPGIEVLFLN